jgi:rod shape-determining protein MreC
MRYSFLPHLQTLFLVVLLVGSFIAISFQVRDPSGTPFFNRGAMAVLAPAQSGARALALGAGSLWSGYLDLVGVRGENQVLRERVAGLEYEIALLREEIARGGREQEFAVFQARACLEGRLARVIGVSADPWARAVVIDRGESAGIARGMPVVTPRGVVGRVTQAGAASALVTLVVDRSSAVAVLVGASRSRAILEGEAADGCTLKYLARAAAVEVGDSVSTSGLGGVYPAGLPVGMVTEVTRKGSGLYQYARVAPAVPFERLEEVLVLPAAPGGEIR